MCAADPEKRASSPGGRHLDASRDDALREAALRLLVEVGYDRLTIEAIAQAAGAGKATIYRRWKNKAALVIDALVSHKRTEPAPDTGSLRGDLHALVDRAASGNLFDAEVMLGLVSALPRDPELREAVSQQLSSPHVETLRQILTRAVERGELARVANVEMIASLVPALVMQRLMIEGRAPDAEFMHGVMDDVVLPIVWGNGAQLDESQRKERDE